MRGEYDSKVRGCGSGVGVGVGVGYYSWHVETLEGGRFLNRRRVDRRAGAGDCL